MNFIRKIGSVNINAIEIASKKHLFKDFVVTSDLDVVFVQEVHFENFCFLPQYTAYVNISKQNKGTAILVRKSISVKNPLLDPSGRIISLEIGDVNLINIYGHSGSQYRLERENLFKHELPIHLNRPSVKHHIVGGDFNCVVDGSDTKNRAYNVSSGLKSLIALFRLKDLDKEINKTVPRKFTFLRGKSASRLDRFYATPDFVKKATDFEIVPVTFSDHHAIKFKFRIELSETTIPIGRGYWKINSSFLKDDQVKTEFSEQYNQLKLRKKYKDNFSEWWSIDLKAKIRQFYKGKSINFNRNVSNMKACLNTKLKKCIEKQEKGEDVSLELGEIKSKMVKIEHNRLKYLEQHMNQTSLLEEEKMSIYQISTKLKKTNSNLK